MSNFSILLKLVPSVKINNSNFEKMIENYMAPFEGSEDCQDVYLKFLNVESEHKKDFDECEHFKREENGKLVKLANSPVEIVSSNTEIITLPRNQLYEDYGQYLESLGYKYNKKWSAYGSTYNPNALWSSYKYGKRIYVVKGAHLPVSAPAICSKIFVRNSSILKTKHIDWKRLQTIKEASMIDCWNSIDHVKISGHKTISFYSNLRKYGFVENEKIGEEYLKIKNKEEFIEKYGYRFDLYTDVVIYGNNPTIYQSKDGDKKKWINNFNDNYIKPSDPNTTLIFLDADDDDVVYSEDKKLDKENIKKKVNKNGIDWKSVITKDLPKIGIEDFYFEHLNKPFFDNVLVPFQSTPKIKN